MPTKNPTLEQKRRWNLATRYKLTSARHAEMVQAQGNRCAVCGGEMKRPVVDHNHKTGVVRAILCHPCNILLPAIENKEWLEKATAYIARH